MKRDTQQKRKGLLICWASLSTFGCSLYVTALVPNWKLGKIAEVGVLNFIKKPSRYCRYTGLWSSSSSLALHGFIANCSRSFLASPYSHQHQKHCCSTVKFRCSFEKIKRLQNQNKIMNAYFKTRKMRTSKTSWLIWSSLQYARLAIPILASCCKQ